MSFVVSSSSLSCSFWTGKITQGEAVLVGCNVSSLIWKTILFDFKYWQLAEHPLDSLSSAFTPHRRSRLLREREREKKGEICLLHYVHWLRLSPNAHQVFNALTCGGPGINDSPAKNPSLTRGKTGMSGQDDIKTPSGNGNNLCHVGRQSEAFCCSDAWELSEWSFLKSCVSLDGFPGVIKKQEAEGAGRKVMGSSADVLAVCS